MTVGSDSGNVCGDTRWEVGVIKYLITTLITAMTTAATVITTIITRAAIYQSCYKKLPFLATFAQLKLGLKTPAQTRPHGMNECH